MGTLATQANFPGDLGGNWGDPILKRVAKKPPEVQGSYKRA